MPVFTAIPELCRRDGICASVCPAHLIRGPKGRLPSMRPGAEDACIACGHCMAFCPHGAARVDVLPLEEMRKIDRSRIPDAASLDMLFRVRRSIRHFTKEPIPKDVLERVLSASRHAPSAKNGRPARFIVAYEPDMMRKIGNHVADWLKLYLADPEGKPALADAKGLIRAWRMGMDPLFRGAPHVVLAATSKDAKWGEADTAIALTYIELEALMHGIGACWAGYISIAARHHPPLQELLGLGADERIQGGQMLGFTALRPTASAPRRPLPVHWL